MRVLFATVAATALFLAGFGSQAAAASAQAARPVGYVTGAALRQLVVGHTLYGKGQYGPFYKTFEPDGTVQGQVSDGMENHYVAGNWHFNKGQDQICDQVAAGSYQFSEVCRTIYWNGKNFITTFKQSARYGGGIVKLVVKFR